MIVRSKKIPTGVQARLLSPPCDNIRPVLRQHTQPECPIGELIRTEKRREKMALSMPRPGISFICTFPLVDIVDLQHFLVRIFCFGKIIRKKRWTACRISSLDKMTTSARAWTVWETSSPQFSLALVVNRTQVIRGQLLWILELCKETNFGVMTNPRCLTKNAVIHDMYQGTGMASNSFVFDMRFLTCCPLICTLVRDELE